MYAYCDCSAGVSGDMFLAALCQLGFDLMPLQEKLAKAGIDCDLKAWQECRAAGPGFRVSVNWPDEQPLRHPKDIADIFHKINVSKWVLENSLNTLDALTLAEAHAHNIKPEEVHFHEVGAIDTLVDILGTALGLEYLGVKKVVCSPLPWFSGTVECAHGILPLPAPATAFLLMNKPIIATDATTELITPTGAALIHALHTSFASAFSGIPLRMGTGYGSRPSNAGLRIYLVEEMQEIAQERIAQLESNIDHLTAEEIGAAIDALSNMHEVLDVLWLHGIGKKNRPMGVLRVLCAEENLSLIQNAIFKHTHTLGVRHSILARCILPRESVQVGEELLCGKKYTLDGQDYIRLESDELIKKAKLLGVGVPALRVDKT